MSGDPDRAAYGGATIFDGENLIAGHVLLVEEGRVAGIAPTAPAGWPVQRLEGGVLAPGLIDLQVNGGGGAMVGAGTTAATLARLCDTHARLGATGILPTLITDTPEVTARVIEAGIAAHRARTPGFLGLHLEGPHLDPRRHGAHDPALIRPLADDDLTLLRHAARALPALMVTLAPVAATPAQITALTQAGAVVSLGHAECSFDEAMAYGRAGARAVTHLFNAMSPLTSREPGLVGAALAGDFDVGLIADGFHVHPETLRLALAAKREGRVFLITDAMAVAGSDLDGFTLGGRGIERHAGRLTLADGTLAGADLTLPGAIATLVQRCGIAPERALAMACGIPARVIGADAGTLMPGARADMVHLAPDWQLRAVWREGVAVSGLEQ